MPSISVLGDDKGAREGYQAMAQAFGPGGPGPVQLLVPPVVDAAELQETLSNDPSVAMAMPAQPGGGDYNLITAFGMSDPSSAQWPHSGLRDTLPLACLGGPVLENYDLDHALLGRLLVMATVLVRGCFCSSSPSRESSSRC
jgi:RND superfamily putative drug exporter